VGKGLLVVALLAVVIYVTIRFFEKRRTARKPGMPRSPRRPPRRVIAPDDDADFLRDLEQKRRKERRERDEQHGDADSS